MLHRSEDAKLSLVKSLATRASRAASPSHKKNVRLFIEQFYANTAPEDILSEPDTLSGQAGRPPGRFVRAAMRPIGIDDVLVARMTSGRQISSSCLNI